MDPVTRLANDTWEALFRAQATLAQEFELEGDWGGLPPREYGVLYALAGVREGVRVTDLMGDALLTQAGVSRLVARLEKRGLVARRDDPSDARACRIVLTPDGRDVQRRVGRHHARHVSVAMTRALSPAQQETLRDLSRALIAACPTPEGRAPTTTQGTSGPTIEQTRR
jgi:DNA-binding MarR family transcriptional regulator